LTTGTVEDAALGPSALDRSDQAESTATYRPHLDGLRAVAVYLVVLFHAGVGRFSGGYVGVDVFFVLSGYLVTQLLLRDINRGGSIRFGRFFARRFRRLLPAAFVALIVTAIVFTAIAAPAEALDSVGSFKAAFLYSTNWFFIHTATGYFGAKLTADPVLQFWSLAVEEQFYLVWPLVLGGVFAITHRMDRAHQMRVIRIVVGVGAVASAVWALSLRNSNPNRAYYGTDCRAYELLAGASIALVPAFVASLRRFRRSVHIVAASSLVILFGLASSWLDLDAIERGIAVTATACALLVALEFAGGGIVVRSLSQRTIVYLGKISYGTYLWHWIVILVVVRTFHPGSVATAAIACLVATALAALSYEILEQPVRLSRLLDRNRRIVIASGLALSVFSALVLVPRIVDPASASAPAVQGITTGFTPVPPGLDWRHAGDGFGPFVNCYREPISKCTIVKGHGTSILLIGDSHAQMLVPAFSELARREGFTLSVTTEGACPWQRDFYEQPGAPRVSQSGRERCTALEDDLYTRVIPSLEPDVIVATSIGYAAFHPERVSAKSVAELQVSQRKILLVEPMPRAPFNPRTCLSKAKVLEECRYVTNVSPDSLELFYRRLARQNSDVYSADFDRLVCPFLPICDPVVDGQIVKWDSRHLTVKFSETLAPRIDDYLKQAGIIRR
jgi:peptidoglycan/LPS O-acetylase OafA/YrhL